MNAPYWSGDGIELHLGDCREVDDWLAADVLVTDPPYGMAYLSGRRYDNDTTNRIEGDNNTGLRDHMLGMWGTKPGIVFGTWRAPRPAGTRVVAIWNKTHVGPGLGDLTMPFGSSHEELYLIGGPWQLIGKRRGSVISTSHVMGNPSGVVSATGHPTAKPVGLMEDLLGVTTGTVADPFAGSGSTLVAAKLLGRKAIGVEIEERYCEIAARRLDQGILLFDST